MKNILGFKAPSETVGSACLCGGLDFGEFGLKTVERKTVSDASSSRLFAFLTAPSLLISRKS